MQVGRPVLAHVILLTPLFYFEIRIVSVTPRAAQSVLRRMSLISLDVSPSHGCLNELLFWSAPIFSSLCRISLLMSKELRSLSDSSKVYFLCVSHPVEQTQLTNLAHMSRKANVYDSSDKVHIYYMRTYYCLLRTSRIRIPTDLVHIFILMS